LIIRLVNIGGQLIKVEDDDKFTSLLNILNSYSVLIDGVFGTGIKLPLKDDIGSILNIIKTNIKISSTKIHVVAVDCPSGVDCETGDIADSAIPAEMTVTMAGVKIGLIRFPAAKMTGKLRIASIGPIEDLQAYINNHKIVLTQDMVSKYLPERPLDAHKGTFGTALVVAGSINYTGAALLAGFAAYRSGAGLVTMAVPAPLHESLSGQFPESTWVLLPHEMGVISADAVRVVRKNINNASAVLIGPGFGLEDTTRKFIYQLFTEVDSVNRGDIGFIHGSKTNNESLDIQKPIVMDADGLKLMSQIPNWADFLPSRAVLTPHPGEMAVLTGLSIEAIQKNRLEIARQYSIKWGHIVVLKGAFTVVADPDGQIAIVPIASPALARAGTGDVLAGLIVGLRAQGIDAFEAACSGAWIHATAGVLAAKRLGNTASVMASDIINAIPQVISELINV
jgi:NAD(P)H-hydrate epimerase